VLPVVCSPSSMCAFSHSNSVCGDCDINDEDASDMAQPVASSSNEQLGTGDAGADSGSTTTASSCVSGERSSSSDMDVDNEDAEAGGDEDEEEEEEEEWHPMWLPEGMSLDSMQVMMVFISDADEDDAGNDDGDEGDDDDPTSHVLFWS